MKKSIKTIFLVQILIISIISVVGTEKEENKEKNYRNEEINKPYGEIIRNITEKIEIINETEDKIMCAKYYNYTLLRTMQNSKKPLNTHLFIELLSGSFYFVDSTDQTKLLISTDKGVTVVQVDIDPDNDSGDQESRIRKIQMAYHDRDNEIIHFVDCDNDGADNDFDVWKLDYSGSETAPTITDVGQRTTAYNYIEAHDIFKHLDGNVYVIVCEFDSGTPRDYIDLYDVDSAPFTQVDEDALSTDGNVGVSKVANEDINNSWFITKYSTFTRLTTCSSVGMIHENIIDDATLDVPTRQDQRGISFDGVDIIYFILTDSDDSKQYLYKVDLTAYTDIRGGEYDISLMLDRNTYTDNPIPFNLEKAYAITEDKIYQIAPSGGNLNLISVFDFTDNLIAISDHYAIDDSANLYELQDYGSSFTQFRITHDKEDFPTAKALLNSDNIAIVKDLFMQILDIYTSRESKKLYPATFDFELDDNGAIPAGWVEVAPEGFIIDGLDGHKKVFELVGDASTRYEYDLGVPQTDFNWEFYMRITDNTKTGVFRMFETDSAARFFQVYMNNGNFGVLDEFGNHNIATALSNVWYHIRIQVYTDGLVLKYNLWLDGVQLITGNEFNWNIPSFDYWDVLTNVAGVYSVYFDAIGFDFDSDYTVGDNLLAEKGESDRVIFEGTIEDYDEKRFQTIFLINQGSELTDNKAIEGTYSGRSDQIISNLNTAFMNYISDGTLEQGATMGDMIFSGDKEYLSILNGLKDQDLFTWYLLTQGALNYDAGNVSISVYMDETTSNDWFVSRVNGNHQNKGINKVIVRGAIIDGVQIISDSTLYGNDLPSQQQTGIKKLVIIDANIRTVALANARADELVSREGANPITVRFEYKNVKINFMQAGQTFLFKYVTTDVNIPLTTLIIDRIVYEAVRQVSWIEASSGLIFDYGTTNQQLPQENSQQITQLNLIKPTIFVKTADPTVNDDIDLGVQVGDLWVRTDTQKWWGCSDNSDGAAVWDIFN